MFPKQCLHCPNPTLHVVQYGLNRLFHHQQHISIGTQDRGSHPPPEHTVIVRFTYRRLMYMCTPPLRPETQTVRGTNLVSATRD